MADIYRMDSHKLYWHLDRVAQWQRGERIAPLYLDMGITQSCNLQCVYCYYAVPEHRTVAIIETQTLIRFLRDAADIGVRAIGFLGDGEPMIHPGVYDAVEAGKAAGLDMAISTNGVVMDSGRIDGFLSSLSWPRFNISAGTPATYCRVMGADERIYDRVVENIRRSVERKKALGLPVTIGLQMVMIPECEDDIVPFARLGKELGVDYVVVKQCSDRADDKPLFTPDDYERCRPLLEEVEQLSADGYRVIIKWRKLGNQGIRNYDHCHGCEFLPQISGNGDLYSCGAFFGNPDFLVGNIHAESFKTLVYGERYAEVMRRVQTEVDVHRQCGTNCRQNEINEFLWQLKHPPQHVNFI